MDKGLKVNVNYEDYTCKEAYDVDENVSLVVVYDEDENYIGEMVGSSLPDIEDEEEVSKFTDNLSNFINNQ